MTRKLIIGSNGFLGSTFVSSMKSAIGMDRSDLDLSKPISLSTFDRIQAGDYQYIVLCAAITDIEKCFRERQLSERINVTGTRELLDIIKRVGAVPVFFSSDYVFADRSSPPREDAPRRPETLYGKQKVAIEQYLEDSFDRYLIFRTSKLLSMTEHPRNILYQVIRDLRASKPIRAFQDQWFNPVFVEDIARVVDAACDHSLNGTYHLGTRRIFARDEMTRLLAASLGYDPSCVQSIKLSDIQFSEARPNHNTLDCGKIENELGFRFTELEDAIRAPGFMSAESHL